MKKLISNKLVSTVLTIVGVILIIMVLLLAAEMLARFIEIAMDIGSITLLIGIALWTAISKLFREETDGIVNDTKMDFMTLYDTAADEDEHAVRRIAAGVAVLAIAFVILAIVAVFTLWIAVMFFQAEHHFGYVICAAVLLGKVCFAIRRHNARHDARNVRDRRNRRGGNRSAIR